MIWGVLMLRRHKEWEDFKATRPIEQEELDRASIQQEPSSFWKLTRQVEHATLGRAAGLRANRSFYVLYSVLFGLLTISPKAT